MTDDSGPDRPAVRVVGVAGKCCAGKDVVTEWLVARGWREINVDRIGHEALAENHAGVVRRFGTGIIADDGSIDRRALGAIVFADRNRLAELEAILHPVMRRRVREAADAFREAAAAGRADARGLVINAALLFHMRLDEVCDAVVLVRAPFLTRLARARRRDAMTIRSMVRRALAQRTLDAQARSSSADTITVENGGTRERLFERLAAIRELG